MSDNISSGAGDFAGSGAEAAPKRARYVKTFTDALRDRSVSLPGRVFTSVITNRIGFNNGHWPSLARLAAECGMTRGQAYRARQSAVSAGWIEHESAGDWDPGTYRIGPNAPECIKIEAERRLRVSAQGPVSKPRRRLRDGDIGACAAPRGAMDKEYKELERVGNEIGVSPSSLLFISWAQKEHAERISQKQVLHIEPVFKRGVPLVLVQDVFVMWWRKLKPWTFADRCLSEWEDRKAKWQAAHGYYVGHRGEKPADWLIVELKKYTSPEYQAWVLGEDASSAAEAKQIEAANRGREAEERRVRREAKTRVAEQESEKGQEKRRARARQIEAFAEVLLDWTRARPGQTLPGSMWPRWLTETERAQIAARVKEAGQSVSEG